MRYFNCGDVHAGCDKVFRGLDDGGIVERVTEHAVNEHGAAAGDGLTSSIRSAIYDK